ncbi:ABC transporter ATP-binding protein [Desulfovibrio sp. OttesenSCG-928-F20]|nr:ABC transporter ATP-binding protein [Desulfovibrio sp. OttesenSCG-928-F20]
MNWQAAPASPVAAREPLLLVRNLRVGFTREDGDRPGLAVDGLDLALEYGKTLCLVGESGCGKSVTALSLLGLLPSPPAQRLDGSVCFDGQELTTLPERELRRIRGNRVGMIFQDPMTSLNPVMRVGDQMGEALRLHRGLSKSRAREAARDMLRRVGIADPDQRVMDYPHQMSGGMRQRVMIGMALMCDPDLLIADEPTSALDVTVQRQILGLMRDLIRDAGSALLLITHDFDVVGRIADEVAVMYAGRIVEQGSAESLLTEASHPYTVGLLQSRPARTGQRHRLFAIPGSVPGIWSRPTGCAFHPRCSSVLERCRVEDPPFFQTGHGLCRCWLSEPKSR